MCGCVRAFCRFAPGRAWSPTNSPWATGGPTRSMTTGDASICGSCRQTSRDAGRSGIGDQRVQPRSSPAVSGDLWDRGARRRNAIPARRTAARNEIEFSIDTGGRPTRFRGTVAGNAMQSAPGGTGFEQTAGVVASKPSVNHSAKVFFIAATPISIMPLIGPTSSFGRMSITHTKRDLPGPSSNTCATAL